MSLNIKDPSAHQLASALAKATGESMTKAVTRAIEERLARVNREAQPSGQLVSDLLAIGKRCAAELNGKPVRHDRLLYDRAGLPK